MDPYIGEIRLFAGTFAPVGWAFCDGQILRVAENQALFSVIGNPYGGDGKTTFALPDLRGYAPMHFGAGTGLTPRKFNEKGGTSFVTLMESQMPKHSHTAQCQTTSNSTSAEGTVWGTSPGGKSPKPVYSDRADTPLNALAIQPAGGGKPHNNMQPYLTLNFIIALDGIYPVKG